MAAIGAAALLLFACWSLASCGAKGGAAFAPESSAAVDKINTEIEAEVTHGTRSDGVLLTWQAVPFATRYEIVDDEHYRTLAKVSAEELSWLDVNLASGHIRQYRIHAYTGLERYSTSSGSDVLFGWTSNPQGEGSGRGGPLSWNAADGDVGRSGNSRALSVRRPNLQWQRGRQPGEDGRGVDTLIADDGTIYAQYVDRLIALDASGHERWSKEMDYTNIQLLNDGRILTCFDYHFAAFNPDGSVAWARRLPEQFEGKELGFAPDQLLYNGKNTIFATVETRKYEHLLCGLDLEGELLWVSALPGVNLLRSAVDEYGEMICHSGDDLIKVSAAGLELWRSPPQNPEEMTYPSVSLLGTYILRDTIGGVDVLNHSGAVVYRYRSAAGDPFMGLHGTDGTGRFVVSEKLPPDPESGDSDVVIRCLNVAAQPQWTYRLGPDNYLRDYAYAQPGQFYLLTEDGLLCLDDKGRKLWELDSPHSSSDNLAVSPAGSLIVNSENRLLCYSAASGPPPAPSGFWTSAGNFSDCARLGWEAAPGALGYQIYRNSSSEPYTEVGQETSWLDTEVPARGALYWVRAFNEHGAGPETPRLRCEPDEAGDEVAQWLSSRADLNNTSRAKTGGPDSYSLAWKLALPDFLRLDQISIGPGGIVLLQSEFSQPAAVDPEGRIIWNSAPYQPAPFPQPMGLDGRLFNSVQITYDDWWREHSWSFSSLSLGGIQTELGHGEGEVSFAGQDREGRIYLSEIYNPDPDDRFSYRMRVSVLGPDNSLTEVFDREPGTVPLHFRQDSSILMRDETSRSYYYDDKDYATHDLVCLDPSGVERWRFSPASRVPAVDGQFLAASLSDRPVTAPDGSIYISMYVHWVPNVEWWLRGASNHPPDSQSIPYLLCLNPDGTLRWYQKGLDSALLALGPDNSIIVGRGDNSLARLSSDGVQLWRMELGDLHEVGRLDSIVSDNTGRAYCKLHAEYSTGGSLYCLAPEGAISWSFHGTDGSIGSSNMAISADGHLYYAEEPGTLVCLGPGR
ncbi:PQQ-binding-like beta-propeller repeat protein [bacterium]|nr:PQQ-binding-like beta-propeller repeat protein [bacterium]